MQLQELKKEFERSHHEVMRFHALMKKREQVIQNVDVLKEKLERELIRLHHVKPHEAAQLKLQISQDSELVEGFKRELKAIDEEIDQIGENKEEHYEQIREELLKQIQNQSPESVAEYRRLESQLKTGHEHQERLLKEKRLLEPLWETFQRSAHIDLKGSFWNFLLGKNPKALVAHALDQAQIQAESAKLKMEEGPFKKFLDKFLAETMEKWKKEVQQSLPQFHNELSQLMKEQAHNIEQTQQKIERLENELEQWINQYTG